LQATQAPNDELIKELQAKNAELSAMSDKVKEQVDNIRQDLDKVTADRNKLESECDRLQRINTVSRHISEHYNCAYNVIAPCILYAALSCQYSTGLP